MFPPLISGVAKKLEEKGEGGRHTSESPMLSSISSRSNHQTSRSSSNFSGLSDRHSNSSTSHFSSSPPSFRSTSPCVPTCRPIPLYLRSSSSSRTSRLGSKCSTSLPESIAEEEDEVKDAGEVGGAGKKKKKNKKKRKRRNTVATGTVVSGDNPQAREQCPRLLIQ